MRVLSPSELTDSAALCRALLERSQNAAVVAALAHADHHRAERAVLAYGELPAGFMLLQLAVRRSEAALQADLYARQCEREFVAAWLRAGRGS